MSTKPSTKSQEILSILNGETKLGDLRTIGKEIKKDHELALELWSAGKFLPRMLSILIMDKKQLHADIIDRLFEDMQQHPDHEKTQLADWLMANQLTKDKKLIAMIEDWQNSAKPLQRRIFWYYQGRLRWMGQTPPENSAQLLSAIAEKMPAEAPEVQWAMNFTAGWMGIYDRSLRDQCIKIGEDLGLYKDEVVHKGCTPNYLPQFIEIEAKKRNLS